MAKIVNKVFCHLVLRFNSRRWSLYIYGKITIDLNKSIKTTSRARVNDISFYLAKVKLNNVQNKLRQIIFGDLKIK